MDADHPEGGVDLECQFLFNVEHQHFESEIIYMDNFYIPLDFCTLRKSTVARLSVEKEKTCARESSPANLRTMETIKSLRKKEFVATAWWDKNCLLVQIFFRFDRTNWCFEKTKRLRHEGCFLLSYWSTIKQIIVWSR